MSSYKLSIDTALKTDNLKQHEQQMNLKACNKERREEKKKSNLMRYI